MTEPTAELIAGKYKTQDDLVKAYKDAESELGKLRAKLAQRETPTLPDTLKAKPDTGEPDAGGKNAEARAAAKVQAALNALIAGNPQAESLLGELGLPAETSRMALGIAAKAQKSYVDNIYKAAGGEAAYKEMIRWFGESPEITDYERESAFAEIESGNPSRVHAQVRVMRQRYEQEVGNTPAELVIPVPGGDPERILPFADQQELARAYADKKYDTDPAYRAKTDARARISEFKKARS